MRTTSPPFHLFHFNQFWEAVSNGLANEMMQFVDDGADIESINQARRSHADGNYQVRRA